MLATHPVGYLRFLISIAALGLLAALLLLPAPVRADSTAPMLLGARVSGTSLVLIYDEALKTDSVPAASAYSVAVGGATGVAPSSVAVSGARVTLTLSAATTTTTTPVTVTYTVPSTGNKLEDAASNAVAALPTYTVANNNATTNAQPVFSSATTRSVAENTATGMNVGTAVSITGTDDDALTYALVGPDASSFTIEMTNGQIQTSAALDFEIRSTYNVVVSVRDNKTAADGTDSAIDDAIPVTINVTDVNDAPDLQGTFHVNSFPENTTAIRTYTVYDPDQTDTHSWSVDTDISAGNEDRALFQISQTAALSFITAPDYENPADDGTDNTYLVRLKVIDNGSPPLSDVLAITVIVTDVNEAPVITTTGGTYETISVPEGTETSEILATYQADDPEMGMLTWAKTGDDADDFTFVNGVLKFRNVPNYESPADNGSNNVYDVTVNVRDDNGSTIDASLPVTITVTNVEEDGTVSISGTLSGGEVLTASVTDIDGTITSLTWQWAREGSDGSFSNISGATSAAYTAVAADVGNKLRVTANYTDPEGSGKTAEAETSSAIGSSNSAPTFINGMTATRTLPENSGLGVNVVGGTITATDSDSGDTLVYAIKSGNDGGSFTIDTTDGQLKSKAGITYNFEATKNSYTVIVTVHDGKDAAGDTDTTIDDEITVTINLTNVNEEPVLTSPPTTKSVPENSTAVHSYAATDVDAGTVFSWSVTGADDDKFAISSSGVLTFISAPDYENPTDTYNPDMDNEYIVTVRVTDNGSTPLNDGETLRVTVTNINEAPEITSTGTTFTAPSFDENGTSVVATYTATDVDANSNLTWSVENNDFGDFNIMENADGDGELTFKMPPNYEAPIDADTNNTYSLTVKVRDNHTGNLTDTLNVVVTVNDVNETPVISGGATPSFAEIEFDVDGSDTHRLQTSRSPAASRSTTMTETTSPGA